MRKPRSLDSEWFSFKATITGKGEKLVFGGFLSDDSKRDIQKLERLRDRITEAIDWLRA